MDRIELLKELADAFGISGFEEDIAKILIEKMPKGLKIDKDGIGSVIAEKVGSQETPRIMIAAHLDEIGFMVKEVTKDGFIKFLSIGGWYMGNLPGMRVRIKTRKGDLVPGVIGMKPPHELNEEERKQIPKIEHLYIDVGATKSFKLKEKLDIRPGDPIVPDYSAEVMANSDLLLGKAWDDRAGCGLLIDLAHSIIAVDHPNTIYMVASVQEEVGLRGAKTAAQKVNPDIGFAIDVSVCRDTPGNEPDAAEQLGSGVSILIYDSTMIPHRRLRNFVCEIADLNSIPYHLTSLRGGYDTGRIHLTNFGVPSLAIGIPSRYIHSGSSIISLEDYENVLKLLTLIIKSLDSEALNQIMT